MDSRRGAIAPSLRATLDWLRARARASPQGQLQVGGWMIVRVVEEMGREGWGGVGRGGGARCGT